MKPKSYTDIDVYNAANVSFIIDFYTSKSDNFLCEDLSVILNEYISLIPKYNTSYLEKEYNSEKSKYKLHICEGNYNYRKGQLQNLFNYLNEYTFTDNTSLIKTKLSFNHRVLNTLYEIKDININKFILSFDGYKVQNIFTENLKNPKVLSFDSLKRSKLISRTLNYNNLYETSDTSMFPICFNEYSYNYLTFNYIGGENVFENTEKIDNCLKYYIIETYKMLNTDGITIDNTKIMSINNDNIFMLETSNSPSNFVENYDNIYITVDLSNKEQSIKVYWDKIKESLFLIHNTNPNFKGFFNYDTDTNRCQLKEGSIKNGQFENFDFINCEIDHVSLNNCILIGNDIKNASICEGILYSDNNINNCIVNNAEVFLSNNFNDCKICSNKNNVFESNAENCIIKNMYVSNNSDLINTTVINTNKNTSCNNNNNFNIKDYNWLKSL